MPESLRPDASHVSDYVADRGPARYFHGRERILSNFNKLVKESVEAQGGSTFLIQGAPGAGKTALLDQCEKHAKACEWDVTNIGVGALWDPNNLLASLGLGEKYKGTERSTQIGFKNFLGWGFKSTRPQSTVKDILNNGNTPLLLILDEAQALGDEKVPPDNHRSTAIEVLEAIHNGKLERPVILLAAGLGTTKTAFGSLRISRFKGGCFVELGALGKEAERAVLQDWLIKEGGAKGNPTAWIDAIAQKTHGWPQHITAYADAAAKQIRKDNGDMTSTGMEAVYRLGMERRDAYYKQRVNGISRKERFSLARLVKNVPIRDGLDKEDIEATLSQEYGPDKAQDLFNRVLERGVLHSQDGVYTIPIPSMHNWLVSNYVPAQKPEFG
ncbi:MAG: ATP-binding protein [Rhodothermaceae bacterium]|nr:ATP-binding protein [Rhodothermaceae bacterium]MYG68944.1 ATP-binding protein [Rhodothermaceae bacterium]MYJ45826.1 ATP-binding protein [Rhodothermaceae bacterium]